MQFHTGFAGLFAALLTAGCASVGAGSTENAPATETATSLPAYCVESECNQAAQTAIADAKKLVIKKLNTGGEVGFNSVALNTGKQDGIAMICGNVTVTETKTMPVPVSNRFIARANGTAVVLDREVLDFHLTWARFCEK